MKFKERGITVGDLLIFIIVILISLFAFSKIKNDKNQESLSYSFKNSYHVFQYEK